MNLEEVVAHIADVDATIDPKNAQQVLGKFSALAADARQKKEIYAKRMWSLGVLLAKNETKLTTADLARAFDIDRTILSRAKTIAKMLDLDDRKFERRYEELGSPSWYTFMSYFYPRMRKTRYKTDKARDIIKLIKQEIENSADEAKRDEVFKTLLAVQRLITRVLPKKWKLADTNYLPYSPCACCGEYLPPPENGYKLLKYGDTGLEYPICDSCDSVEATPDPAQLIKLYGYYSLNLEHAIEELELFL